MESIYIAIAIPVFFAAIGVELLVGRLQGVGNRYRFADSITNLSCGIGSLLFGLFWTGMVLAAYVLIYEHVAPWKIPLDSALGWVVAVVGVDLCYYCFHRSAHRINFLWAGHQVHHHSEEYNLSVALRQSWFVGVVRWLFYAPLVALGFPPVMVISLRTLNTLYQFWVHTRALGTLGPLEWVMNTPSHHRVHHGINPKYIDRNFAGMFIIWDRLFGTFVREEEEPVYGTVKPLASWNPLWANVVGLWEMIDLARRTRRLGDKLKVWFMPPEWRPQDQGGAVEIPAITREGQARYDPVAPSGLAPYIVLNFVMVAMAVTAFLVVYPQSSAVEAGVLAALTILTMVVWGALFEGKDWALPLEVTRLLLVGMASAIALGGVTRGWESAGGVALVTLLLLLWLIRLRWPPAAPRPSRSDMAPLAH